MQSKSLLIIGGTGFFGKSILDYLKNHNILKLKKIIILSRVIKNIKIDKILKKKFKIIEISANIHKIKKLPDADYVIYAAILKNYNQDVKAANNYLNLAVKYHLNSKILYISSGAVYGIQKSQIKELKENHLAKYKKIFFKNGYKKNYSRIKLENENLFKEFAAKGLNISIARCFSFVGPNLSQNSHYVIGNIINNILKNKNINIKANYKVMRSYMYSDDLVRWLLKILDNSNKQCPTYNVGSNNKISIQNTANFLAKKYGLKVISPKILSKKVDNYIPNIEKAKKELNLNNYYTSLSAIIKTINILKKNTCS
jgi:nucleoside-diphosphate-sugar epimerase